jgi:hypothetical protein
VGSKEVACEDKLRFLFKFTYWERRLIGVSKGSTKLRDYKKNDIWNKIYEKKKKEKEVHSVTFNKLNTTTKQLYWSSVGGL